MIEKLKHIASSNDILRGAATTFAIQAAGAGLAYGLQVLLARWLGVNEYGQYVYAIAWVTLLAVPAALGLGSGSVRFVSEYKAQNEMGLLRGMVTRGYQLVVLGAAAVMLLALGGITAFGTYLDYTSVLYVAVLLIPVRALYSLQVGIGRGLKNMVVAYAPQKVLRPVLLIGVIGGAVWLGRDVTAAHALWMTIGVGVGVILVQGLLIGRTLPAKVRAADLEYKTREWLRVAFPLLLISGFVLLLGRTDVIMLGVLKDAEGVGIYNVASRTATLVTFILTSVNAIAGPTIASLYSEGKDEELQRLASNVVHYIFWPSLLIGIGLVILSSAILGLFGEEYLQADSALWILVVGYVVNAGAGSVGYFMSMTGHQDDSAKVFGWTAVLNIILNAIAIPFFGVIGAATATAISMAIWNVWMNYLVIQKIGVHASILYAVRRAVLRK